MHATVFTPGRKKARIEIIPLIDVVFFLLATFVLFTLSLDRIGTMTAHLPSAIPTPAPQDTTVFIQATARGMVYWKEGDRGTAEMISLAEIPAKLAEYKARVAVPRVLVGGDNQAKFGTAAAVFDDVRLAGISEVSIETMTSRTGN